MAAIVKGIYVDNARVVDDEEKQRILANQASGGSSSSSSSSSGSSKPKEEQEIEKPEVKQEEDLFSPEKKEQPEIQQEPEKKQPTVIFSTEDQQRQLAQIRSQRWYSGDTPTEVEILAQITRIAEVDYAEGQSLADLYLKQKSEGMYAQTYASATSQYMKDLGIDPSQMTPEAIAEFQGFIDQYGVNTASGGVSTAKRNGKNAKLASDLSNLLKDHFETQEILKEQDDALREASYWIAQGLTDDEIIKKLGIGSGGKYTKLNKLFEKGEVGEIVPTTAAIALGTDYGLQGALYMMRNPDGSSGDVLFDAVNALLGRGAKNPSTPQDIARRTPGDPAWAPYATSGTMHDEAIKFGVTGFDRKWLDDNYARIANSGDQDLINAYGRVAEGVERTEKAQQEAAAFRKTVDSMIASGMSADRIFTDDLLEEYPTLKAMYEGQQKLKLVDTTSPVDFDLYALRNEAEKAYKDVEGTVPGKDYAQRLETNLGASTPSYEGDAELDKAEEENLTLVQEIMYFTSTPHEQDAAKSSKPNYYRVMASAASGVSAGTGGTKEAYNSAITAANDYAGAHYLTAVGALAEAQQHLNGLKDAAKPMDDFLEKWFPEQDKGKVAEGLVNGDIATPDNPEFQKEFGEMKRHLGDYQTYLTNLKEAEGAVANEQRIIDNIAAQYAAAEELNTTGAPSQSAMPMLNYISQYTNYNAKQEYASFGDWQYDVEIHDVPWSEASELLGKRKENNQKDLEYLDTAIEYAENHHADEQTLTNMRRTRDVIEADNRSIDYAQLQDVDGFKEAVAKFDAEEKTGLLSFGHDNVIHDGMVNYNKWQEQKLMAEGDIPEQVNESQVFLMTDNERDTYKYLYVTQGKEAATEYVDFLSEYYLGNRKAAYVQMETERLTEEHPIAMNAITIAGSPLQALGAVEVVRAVLTGDEIDPNSEFFRMGQVVGEVRDTSTEMIVEHFGEGTTAAKVATFAYQTGTSIGDSLAAAPLGGAVTMGLESFANTAMEATLNGGDKWDVILLAGITGLAEVGTEYIPMKGLEDAFKAGGKTGLKNHLADLMKSAASGLTEAPGEALSELISGAADTIIMDELSAYSQNVAQYRQSGMTEEEANRKATQDFWKNVGMAGLQGLASGGVQNTVAYVAGSALSNKPQQARPVMEEQTAAPAVEEAPAVTEETAVVQEEVPAAEPGGGLLAEAMAEQNAVPEITPEPDKAKNTRMVNALATAQQDGVSLSDRTATVNGVLEAGGLEPGLALAYAKEIAKDIPGLQQLQQSIQKMTTGDTATTLKAAAYRMFAPPANADTMSDADVVSAVESDPKLSGAVENAVLNSDIATETMNVLKGMDKKAVENATSAQQSAKRAMNGAATEMGTKNAAAGAAFRALQSANEALKQNPADPKAANKAVEAAKQHQLKKAEAEEARRRYEASKQTFLDANKALQKEKQKALNEARRAAKETVMQRRAEQMAAAQQQKEAEAQRVAEQNAAMEQKAAEEIPEVSPSIGPAQYVTGENVIEHKVASPVEVARNLADVLNIGEYIGTRKMNTTNKDVLGTYAGKKGFVTVRGDQASNLTVLMHEIGHAVSHKLKMWGNQSMIDNLTDEIKDNVPQAEHKFEAFAEFFWRYMTNDQDAEDFAGSAFIRSFEKELRKSGYAEAVHDARDQVREYVNADVNNRIGAVVRNRSEKPKSTIREWFDKALAGLTDSTAPLERLNESIRGQAGTVSASDNIRDAALMRNTASKRAWNILTQNMTDSTWTVTGDSLASAIEASGVDGKDFDLLNNYMLALHSLDRDEQGLPVFDANITKEQREEFIANIQRNNPAVAKAEEAIHNWWHNFMQTFMVDTGYLDQEVLDKFEEMYPHYVPTNRVMNQGVGGREANSGKSYSVRRAKGGTQEIYNPLDSMVQNVETIVQMVSQNNVALTWDRLYNQYDGLGIYGRRVNQDLKRDAVAMDKVQEEVKDILQNGGVFGTVVDKVLEAIGEEQQQFRASGNVNLPNVLRVQRPDGSKVFYEIQDNEMFKALSGLREPEVSSVLDYLGRFTRGMAALTTGSNPLFSFRNFMRDFQKSVTYGSWATDYGTGLVKWLRSAYDVWTNSGEYEQYKALGGGGWTRIEAGTKKGADEYRGALFRGYNTSNIGRTAKWAGKKLWNTLTLERVNEVVEQASRYAEYKYGQQDKSTAEGRQKAFLNAQEATVDFSRTGNSHMAVELKKIIPFFNASMQGVYQTGREYLSKSERDRLPARFGKTVANTVLASALASAFMLKNMDEEDKEEFFWLSDDLKAEHIYLPNFLPAVFGEAPLLRIPLAQDPLARAVHGLVTNLIWNNQGDEPVIEASVIAGNILDGFNPVSGTIFDAALAMKTNTNWYGGNIVPTRMESLNPTVQYTEETPDLFVDMAYQLNTVSKGKLRVSPMKLQYLAEQYLGFAGQIVIPAISKDKHTGEMQGIEAVIDAARKKLTSDPLVSNDVVSAFYDGADMLEEIHTAAKQGKPQIDLNRSLSEEEVKAAADEARAMGLTGGIVYDTKKMITDSYNRIDEIEANTSLTDKEKYQLTSEIRREMLENVLDANEAIGEYKAKYVTGESMIARMFDHGDTTALSTSFEKLPESFRNAYDNGEVYMHRSYDVWQATGKDSALPKVNTTFSINNTDYVVADADVDAYTSYYQQRYEEGVYAIHNWDELSEEQRLEALKKVHTNAHNKTKKWYANGMK